jgi:hypothetical protein
LIIPADGSQPRKNPANILDLDKEEYDTQQASVKDNLKDMCQDNSKRVLDPENLINSSKISTQLIIDANASKKP